MTTLLVYSALLLAAVLVSERANRSVLSAAVLFLVAGYALGPGTAGVLEIQPRHDLLERVAEIALFAVLFTDGMRVGIRDLAGAWRLPGRALLLGMPLTFGVIALLGRYVAGLPWSHAALLAAALSPTDPVFAQSIVGREEVPGRLRHLLNVESGINDGLALPVVVLFLVGLGDADQSLTFALARVAGGIGIGVAVPLIAVWLEDRPLFGARDAYRRLLVVAVALVVFSACALLELNEFLAAFAAGITLASVDGELRDRFHDFGEDLVEIAKLGALLIFGALLSIPSFDDVGVRGYVFVVLTLFASRPAALAIALAGSALNRREWFVAAWFGPKGFASVVYGLLIVRAGIGGASHLFHLLALVTAASIIAHSSTDVLVARWFERAETEGARGEV